MASTFSTYLQLELMADGEKDTTWGQITNDNLQYLERAVNGVTSSAVPDTTAGLVLDINQADLAGSDGLYKMIDCTGALTANRPVDLPSESGIWIIENSTTGGFDLTVGGLGGTDVTCKNGEVVMVYSDGTNTKLVQNSTTASPVITGSPTAAGATWADLGAVTTIDINGGTIDGATIGGSSAGAGTFTALTATTSATLNTGGGTNAVLTESGLDKSSGSAETFNLQNSGAGALTLQVDGVAVPTISSTSTLTNKSLTSPTVTGSPTAAGATWADLGTVTTADINGGTIDGAAIGGASAGAGTFTTFTSNGIDDNASSTALEIESNGTLNVSNVTNYETLVTADDDIPNKKYVDDAGSLGRGYIGGLLTSNGTDSDHDIDIAVGVCMDVDGDTLINIASAVGKQLDTTWATGGTPGTPTGGLSSSLSISADTGYYVHAFIAGGVAEIGFDTSATAANLVADHSATAYRPIGYVVTDGSSNIIAYTQVGDYFRFTGDIVSDIVDSTITNNTFEVGALSVPISSLAHIYVSISNKTEMNGRYEAVVRTNGAVDAIGSYVEAFIGGEHLSTVFDVVTTQGLVLVDGSSQIEYAADENSGATTLSISTIGFTMLKRSNL